MALKVLYLWPSRYNSNRTVGSLLCDSHRRCFCMHVYVFALLYVSDVCEWTVHGHRHTTRNNTTKKSGGLFSKTARQPLRYTCGIRYTTELAEPAARPPRLNILQRLVHCQNGSSSLIGRATMVEALQVLHISLTDEIMPTF